MYSNNFNLCQSCVHEEYCSLTTQKHTVWDCSDFSEMTAHKVKLVPKPVMVENEKEPVMAMV